MVFGFYSCTKEQELNITENSTYKNKGITNSDGIMVFENHEVFKSHLDWILPLQNTPEIIEEFNGEIGIKSLNTIYSKGNEINDYDEFVKYVNNNESVYNIVEFDSSFVYEKICPTIYSFVCNTNGLYQVGDVIYRVIKNDGLLKINSKTENAVSKLMESTGNNLESEITYTSTLYKTNSLKWGQYSYRTAYRGEKYRLVARLKTFTNDGNDFCIEATSNTQRRRLRIWIGENLSGDIGITASGSTRLYEKLSNKWRIFPCNMHESGNWQSVSYTVFSFWPSNHLFDNENSCITTVHTGAGQTITNDNIFVGSSLK